ncbi:MAG: hypothetical protein HZB67_03415 [Candidatus Aenigmarchaeota archaeon]|nr:hypothetical protein [Candidatus Aenigmarchaeota archaeon]
MSNLKQRALQHVPKELDKSEIDRREKENQRKIEARILEKAKENFGVDWYPISCNKHTYSCDGPHTSYTGRIRHEDVVLGFSCGEFGELPTFSFTAKCSYRFGLLGTGAQCYYNVKNDVDSLGKLGHAIKEAEEVHQHHYFKPAAGGIRRGPMSEGRYHINENGDIIIY